MAQHDPVQGGEERAGRARWEALFADLEAAAEGEEAADLEAELADRVVAERGRLRLPDRLRPLLGRRDREIAVRPAGHPPVRGRVSGLGADWLSMSGPGGEEWLLPLAAVSWVRGAGPESAEPGWEGLVGARLTVRLALRRLLRERVTVTVCTTDGESLPGVITTVGHDHVELVGPNAGSCVVPLAAIAYVARR